MSTAEVWARFADENAERLRSLRRQLQLWKLEVLATRTAYMLWPTDATRKAYMLALSEREKVEATVLALES